MHIFQACNRVIKIQMKLISSLLANIKYIYIYSTIALKCKPKDTTLSEEFQNESKKSLKIPKG